MRPLSAPQRTHLFDTLLSLYTGAKCELHYKNDYTLLIAILLSAQSTDKGVNKITPALFEKADNPQKMLSLGQEQVKAHIKSINYFNNKTKSILALSQQLITRHNGTVPHNMIDLMNLSGVGRKTASVFLNVADNAPIIGVDTHVYRLCHRLHICTGKTPDDVAHKLHHIVPDCYKSDFALALIMHGRYVCTAKNPQCATCALYDLCQFIDKKEKPTP